VDGLTFVDHLIGHLMWPVIAVVALVAFYPVLRDRLGGLVRIKVGPGGVEGEFAGVLEASDRIMADAPVPPPSQNVVEDHERFERIAAISPRAAVLEAFTVVDNTLKERLLSFGVVSDASGVSGVRSTDAIVEAERIGLLDDAAVEVWKNLRALSNTARHESGLAVTREQALDYGRLAAQLLSTIQHAVPSAPPAVQKDGGPPEPPAAEELGGPVEPPAPPGAGRAPAPRAARPAAGTAAASAPTAARPAAGTAAAPAPRAARPAAPKASRRSPARPAAAKAGGRPVPPAGAAAAGPAASGPSSARTTEAPDLSDDGWEDPMYDPVNSPS
jgi:hypothetical protein